MPLSENSKRRHLRIAQTVIWLYVLALALPSKHLRRFLLLKMFFEITRSVSHARRQALSPVPTNDSLKNSIYYAFTENSRGKE
jgi:hypothetical protein